MCGIAGIVRPGAGQAVDEQALLRMARAVRHRGPDGFGLACLGGAGLVSTRLAIVDLPCGWQPLRRAGDRTLLVYNGEVYNHPELRAELSAAGATFDTDHSDTEVVLRLLESDGPAGLDRLNGQFAFAWWEPERRRLTLARDRFGVRPLHYALLGDGSLVFGSEAKALFASGEVRPEPDPVGLDDVFTLWAPHAPRTAFRGVAQVPPGGLVVWEGGRIVEERRWWRPEQASGDPDADLEALLAGSVEFRLRADVPVGAYLSGGLDSSVVTALARRISNHPLRTFSVAFVDPRYDESAFQRQVAAELDTIHHVVECGPADIAEAFPAVVRACESPLVRTAPVPLWLLSREVREQGITVVLSGEGADELFWGYDLLKEVALRELHVRDPERAEAMVDRLYPELGDAARRGPAWRRFLLEGAQLDDPLGSHRTRATATGAIRGLYRPEIADAVASVDPLARLRGSLPAAFDGWAPLERAAHLELTTLLGDHLLAAQGDRVAMAHGVEGRYPFLDHRVHAYAAALPAERKLDGEHDKVALREVAERLLPASIAARRKQPYKAPDIAPFFAETPPAWVDEALDPDALRAVGIFAPDRVAGLVRRCRSGRASSPREGMALVGVLSTQIWHAELCSQGGPADYPEETARARVRITDLEHSAA
jgi:asparagine synthase (glutamine-hydrolysing)